MIEDADEMMDLDDGATEVVASRPARGAGPTIDFQDIAAAPAGGRLVKTRKGVPDGLSNFITLRTPLGAAKIALSHASIYHQLWSLWSAKRADEAEDPGVSVAEIVEAEKTTTTRVRQALESLARNRVIRVITKHVGYQGTRARYYPTEIGIQAFALAEVLGLGSFVQVGRASKAWRGRNKDEPNDLFQFASFVRGGASL